jgi:hypothetical protein
MKNATRRDALLGYPKSTKQKFRELQALIQSELLYGVPCYEEGSLTPKGALEEIFKRVVELDVLINEKSPEARIGFQPPATPEALYEIDEISEAIE